MQAKKRYLLLSACSICLLLCFLWPKSDRDGNGTRKNSPEPKSFFDAASLFQDADKHFSPRQRRELSSYKFDTSQCKMENCFDFSKCKNGFKVYVYPIQDKISATYSKILMSIRESVYYTPNPDEACLFVLSLDTLDRDVLSKECVKNLPQKISSLPTWNNGKNHVIFSLYSGTWPDYVEELDFDIGYAMLAKASMSITKFRQNFDISMPLFSKSHPAKGGEPGRMSTDVIPAKPKYTLAFKGKRYLTGIGSETRNALYHVHNNEDIVLITTCKHGKSWQQVMDDRCVVDNKQYDMFDYQMLLHNSTFCLVPRGRRLGSFRFLEVLQAACIPVVLSNRWQLPFSDVIDWKRALILGDERLLLQVPDIVRSVSRADILSYRQQTQFLWDTYFSSVDKIIHTTLEIIKSRVYQRPMPSMFVWNTPPGALAVSADFSVRLPDYPFYYDHIQMAPSSRFTTVIYVQNSILISSSPLYKLVKTVAQADGLDRILIIWHCESPPPPKHKWPVGSKVPILVKQSESMTISARFLPDDFITTDAILSLDEDVLLTTDEINFAFSVWQSFPDRIVGYPPRGHFWDDARSQWGYTSKWTNDYSMVLTGAAFIHRYYTYAYTHMLRNSLRQTVDQLQNCEDILMNFLVSHVTQRPPVKVTQRRQYKESMLPGAGPRSSRWLDADHFMQRQVCMNTLVTAFGYMPLKRSKMRLDPSLFKDPVSIVRKKYKTLEKVL